jgi:hypothetical protein
METMGGSGKHRLADGLIHVPSPKSLALPLPAGAPYVMASEAKQSPMRGVEIASSLRSSQGHYCDRPLDFAFALGLDGSALYE